MKNTNSNSNSNSNTNSTSNTEKEEASSLGFNGKLPCFYGNCQDGFIEVIEYSIEEFEIIEL